MGFLKIYVALTTIVTTLFFQPITTQQLQPLRSIQLGEGGARPVSLGSSSSIPSYNQQIAFGPQYQQQPQQRPSQSQIFRRQQVQAQQLQPTYIQQQPRPNYSPFTNQPRPQLQQQPLLLRSPQIQSTTAATDDEEYEDEEYEDPAPPQQIFRPQSIPSIRPIVPQQQQQIRNQPTLRPTPQPQRVPVRQPEIQAPHRFIVSQPQQQQQAQIRRPAQPQSSPRLQPIQLQSSQPLRGLGQDTRLVDGDRQGPTVAPVKTLDRYMRTNEDGSTSWGYTNEDGTFKEETIGVDCVVRGKYGYVDPDGVKREYEYQSGNPCDPNKKNLQEEEDEEVGQQPQRLGGLLSARPLQYQPQAQQQLQQQYRQRSQ